MSSGEPATKKSKTDALPEHLSGIPEETKKVLIEIDSVQNEIDGLNEKASEEILKVWLAGVLSGFIQLSF